MVAQPAKRWPAPPLQPQSCLAMRTAAKRSLQGACICCIAEAMGVVCGGCLLQAPIPKQYLELRGQPIATYSMATFAGMPQVGGSGTLILCLRAGLLSCGARLLCERRVGACAIARMGSCHLGGRSRCAALSVPFSVEPLFWFTWLL